MYEINDTEFGHPECMLKESCRSGQSTDDNYCCTHPEKFANVTLVLETTENEVISTGWRPLVWPLQWVRQKLVNASWGDQWQNKNAPASFSLLKQVGYEIRIEIFVRAGPNRYEMTRATRRIPGLYATSLSAHCLQNGFNIIDQTRQISLQ